MAPDRDFYSDAGIIADPHGYFAAARGRCPIHQERFHGTAIVSGYDEALEVLTDRSGVFSNACSVVGPMPGLPFVAEPQDFAAQLEAHRDAMPWAEHLVCMDGKRHQDHRMLIGQLLTHTRLKQNETYLNDLADRLIDGFISRGRINLVPDYAHATTTYAISDLMGIPVEDRAKLLDLIGAPPSQIDGDAVHKVGPDPLIFLKERFDGYLRERIAEPRQDLLTELVQAQFGDGRMPDFDAVSALARFVFAAGQDTTSRLIAMAVLILAENSALQAKLRAEPGRIADFLEETLRYDPPVKVTYRLARCGTVVAGHEIPVGTIVTVGLTAAGRDPRRFADPDSFDLERQQVRSHMAFGRGRHACLGAPLGRMEARIAIERLLSRTAAIRISEEHHGSPDARLFRFEPTFTFRSLSDLWVDFEPATEQTDQPPPMA